MRFEGQINGVTTYLFFIFPFPFHPNMSRIPIEATLKTLATKDPPFADFNIQSEEPKEQENNDVESLSKEAEAQARAEAAALEQDKGVTRIEALCKSKPFFKLLFSTYIVQQSG